MSKRFLSKNKTSRDKWSDFWQAASAPGTIFFAVVTLLCFLAHFLPFDSSTSLLAGLISPTLRALSILFFGFTVLAFQKNNVSVVDKETVLNNGEMVKRHLTSIESSVRNLSELASDRKITKQELIRHHESLLLKIRLTKDDLSDFMSG